MATGALTSILNGAFLYTITAKNQSDEKLRGKMARQNCKADITRSNEQSEKGFKSTSHFELNYFFDKLFLINIFEHFNSSNLRLKNSVINYFVSRRRLTKKWNAKRRVGMGCRRGGWMGRFKMVQRIPKERNNRGLECETMFYFFWFSKEPEQHNITKAATMRW